MSEPARILVCGDWHGERTWARACLRIARRLGCPTVVQLGDFGLWPGEEGRWLDFLDREATRAGVALTWIDGNHEDHDSLDRWRQRAGPDGMVTMREQIHWAPRGSRWSWSGVRFGALGGAVSTDRIYQI